MISLKPDKVGSPAGGPDCDTCFLLEYAIWFYGRRDGESRVLPFGQLLGSTPAMWAFNFPRGGDLMTPCKIEPKYCAANASAAPARKLSEDSHNALVTAVATDDNFPRVKRPAGPEAPREFSRESAAWQITAETSSRFSRFRRLSGSPANVRRILILSEMGG